MAGTPIKRQYLRKLKELGGTGRILDQIAAGATIAAAARTAGVSPSFLHYFICSLPGGKAALHLARLKAVESAVHNELLEAESAGRGPTDAFEWIRLQGGFYRMGGSESSAIPAISSYVSARQAENGRLHLEAMKRCHEQERGNQGNPTDLSRFEWKAD